MRCVLKNAALRRALMSCEVVVGTAQRILSSDDL